jgi:hypothetical protein
MTDRELTPEERQALDELPAERPPSDLLEERVVRSLRDRGLLRRERVRVLELTRSRFAAAAAACLLLVVAGFAMGRWTSPSTALEPPAPSPVPARHVDDFAVAASLQQAASAYVIALEDLEASLQTAQGDQARQGREVALASLYSAADRVARLVPGERLAHRFREAVTALEVGDERGTADPSRRQLVEF